MQAVASPSGILCQDWLIQPFFCTNVLDLLLCWVAVNTPGNRFCWIDRGQIRQNEGQQAHTDEHDQNSYQLFYEMQNPPLSLLVKIKMWSD